MSPEFHRRLHYIKVSVLLIEDSMWILFTYYVASLYAPPDATAVAGATKANIDNRKARLLALNVLLDCRLRLDAELLNRQNTMMYNL